MLYLLPLLLIQHLQSTSAYVAPLSPHARISRASIPNAAKFGHEETLTNIIDSSNSVASPSKPSRRSFFQHTTAALLATLGTTLLPTPSRAVDAVGTDLRSCIYFVSRAKEATEQETRLIKSGQFKDMQRANVKLAVKFITQNYRLSDNVIAASSYLEGEKQAKATSMGLNAVQSLITINEYFDSSDVQNIKVGSNSMAGKEALVLKGLDAAKNDIEGFLSYFPSDDLIAVRDKIRDENELNFKEFDPALGTIVNPNPQVK